MTADAPPSTGGLPTSRYDLDHDALANLLAGQPAYRLDQLWQGLYRDLAEPEEMTTLPASRRRDLAEHLPAALVDDTRAVGDRGRTVKWLWRLADGTLIETVLMHYRNRSTVCVSTQAGCAMACGFCATGQMGFDRHLNVGEIVEQ